MDYVMNSSKLSIQQMTKAIVLQEKQHFFSSWACKDDESNFLKTFTLFLKYSISTDIF